MGDLKYSIKYPTKGGPCWKCHIASMGEDALHPPFERGVQVRCENRNLFIGLAYAIFVTPDLHLRAERYFKPRESGKAWESVQQFGEWLGTQNDEWRWQSMALMKWTAEHVLKM